MALVQVSSLSQFKTILQTSGRKLVVVDFYADWCGPCQQIAPFFQQLARRFGGRATFLKVDVDESQDIASFCSVSAMPTFRMYLSGKLVSEFSGGDQRRLLADIERYAPSSADVSFAGSGQKLGGVGNAGPGPSDGAPRAPGENMRDTAAAAAARRMQAMQAPPPDSARITPEAEAKVANEDAANEAPPPEDNSQLTVDPALLRQMVDEMEIPKNRAEKAILLTGNKGIEQAVEWYFEHVDDPDIDEPFDIKANEIPKPKLSQEEAKKKADELYRRARAKREEDDKKDAVDREKDRIRSGKEVTVAKQKYEEEARKRAVAQKKREKLEAMKERQRVRDMLEADKQRRREKFNMKGSSSSNPPSAPAPRGSNQPTPRTQPLAAGGKIQFRLPDGTRLEASFEPEQTVADLMKFLKRAKPDLSSNRIVLSQQYPRRRFSGADDSSTLAELGLLPRGALTVSLV